MSIHGYAANRVFTYAENGIHNEFTAPCGAALIARILHREGIAAPAPLDDSHLREHMALVRREGDKAGCYAIGRKSGITPGAARIDTAPAPCALLWGGGFDTLPISAETPVLWASDNGLPQKELFAEIACRCFLLLDADVLRAAGAMISRQISWERSAMELVWQLRNNPALSYLLQAQHLLITFAEDGAVHIMRDDEGLAANLILAHGGGEGSSREKQKGQIDDAFAVMAAAAALQFEDVMAGKRKLRVSPILRSAGALLSSGYRIDALKECSFEIMPAESAGEDAVFKVPFKQGQDGADPDFWCISNSVNKKRIFDIAYDYVMEGAKVIASLPRFSIGALTTVDRQEIEAFQNVCNLIVDYAGSDAVSPLCIAVFGAPGSGKSFGVTQIAKNVLPGTVEIKEFNVAQFRGLGDLSSAFQKVSDAVLKGKLPLVFFDEFDSDRDSLPLGWLRFFLKPMQKGAYNGENGEYSLGKCIIVFAGGTAASFEEFTSPMQPGQPEVMRGFKNIKGPDFVSRLRGTINILGVNPRNEADRSYILRRALLLRSLCERAFGIRKNDRAPISPHVLWAMLLAPEYKHGARSMDAILEMSRIKNGIWEPATLPSHAQLSIHVDADAFMRLVLRDSILNSYIEPTF